MFYYHRAAAAQHAHSSSLVEKLLADLTAALKRKGRDLPKSNHLGLKRGPFLCGAVLDETSGSEALLSGTYVNLFSPDAALVTNPTVQPGEVYFLREIAGAYETPEILATTARCEHTTRTKTYTEFLLRGPVGTPGVVRIGARRTLPVEVDGKSVRPEREANGASIRLRFTHREEDNRVRIITRY